MKTRCILYPIQFLTIFLCSTYVYAQAYHKTLGTTNEWHIVKSFEGTYTEKFNIGSKQEINGKIYTEFGYFSPNIINEIAYIREDTIGQKIYFLPWNYSDYPDEFLLYDFSIEKGDTIDLYQLGGKIDTLDNFIVDSTNYMNTLGGERKIIYLTRKIYTHVVWIEGIGSLGNFIYPGYAAIEGDYGVLSCFFKDGVHIYQSPDYSSCDVSIDIEPVSLASGTNIYPNPFKNTVTIDFESHQNGTITVINQLGQAVYFTAFTETEKLELDLPHLQDGMYMVLINNGKGVVGRHVIKAGR